MKYPVRGRLRRTPLPPPHPHGALRAPWALLAAWDTLGMALKLLLARVRQREAFGASSALDWKGLEPESGVPFGPRMKSCVPFGLRLKSAVPFDTKPEGHV